MEEDSSEESVNEESLSLESKYEASSITDSSNSLHVPEDNRAEMFKNDTVALQKKKLEDFMEAADAFDCKCRP